MPALGHKDWPLSGLRHSIAIVLSADVEDNWSYVGIEVAIDYVISLFPGSFRLVVEVIEKLIEPVLFLGVYQFLFWTLDWLL